MLTILLMLDSVISLFSGLFPVRSLHITKAAPADFENLAQMFTKSFWLDKRNGSKISNSRARTLESQQLAEFKKRYTFQRMSILLKAEIPFKGINNKPTQPQVSTTTQLLLNTPDPSPSNTQIIGCAAVDVQPLYDFETEQKLPACAVLSNLAITKNFRGRGVAKSLVKSLEFQVQTILKQQFIYLKVDSTNKRAINLYKKSKYKEVWRERTTSLCPVMYEGGEFIMDDVTTTVLVMRKELSA
ncbi:hypothetical protein ScalyP_jg5461 [Parmales sp. scaly parma]|nr:hypothetical protein ScalyP_jg5461 [Parmales sp. scaly parma]